MRLPLRQRPNARHQLLRWIGLLPDGVRRAGGHAQPAALAKRRADVGIRVPASGEHDARHLHRADFLAPAAGVAPLHVHGGDGQVKIVPPDLPAPFFPHKLDEARGADQRASAAAHAAVVLGLRQRNIAQHAAVAVGNGRGGMLLAYAHAQPAENAVHRVGLGRILQLHRPAEAPVQLHHRLAPGALRQQHPQQHLAVVNDGGRGGHHLQPLLHQVAAGGYQLGLALPAGVSDLHQAEPAGAVRLQRAVVADSGYLNAGFGRHRQQSGACRRLNRAAVYFEGQHRLM